LKRFNPDFFLLNFAPSIVRLYSANMALVHCQAFLATHIRFVTDFDCSAVAVMDAEESADSFTNIWQVWYLYKLGMRYKHYFLPRFSVLNCLQ